MTRLVETVLRPPHVGILVHDGPGHITTDQVDRIRDQWNDAIKNERYPIVLEGNWRWMYFGEPEAIDALDRLLSVHDNLATCLWDPDGECPPIDSGDDVCVNCRAQQVIERWEEAQRKVGGSS